MYLQIFWIYNVNYISELKIKKIKEKEETHKNLFVSRVFCSFLGFSGNMAAPMKSDQLSSTYKWLIFSKHKHNDDYVMAINIVTYIIFHFSQTIILNLTHWTFKK